MLDRADPAALQEVTAAGAHGVLCKPVHREQLEATFRLAMDQHGARRAPRPAEDARVRLLEGALHRIAQELARLNLSDRPGRRRPLPICGLRPREQEVVRLLLQHLRVPAIARRLGISQQTVRNHLKSVFRRTGVRSQQELLDRIALASASQPSPEPDDTASQSRPSATTTIASTSQLRTCRRSDVAAEGPSRADIEARLSQAFLTLNQMAASLALIERSCSRVLEDLPVGDDDALEHALALRGP